MAPTHTVLDPPVEPLTLVAEDGALTAVLTGRHRHPGLALGPRRDAYSGAAGEQLQEYLAGRLTRSELALAPVGRSFDHRVWALLRVVP